MDTDKNVQSKLELQEELKIVEDQLESMGKKNPSSKDDWETEVNGADPTATEPDELADRMEEYEENEEEIAALEARRKTILESLEKMGNGMAE